jgi:hypothetical protein
MKKLLYTLLAVSIIFSSCKKEDEEPTNSDEVILTMDSILGTWEIISNEVIFSSETSHIVTDPIYGTQTVTVTNSLDSTWIETPDTREMRIFYVFRYDNTASQYNYSTSGVDSSVSVTYEFTYAITEDSLWLTGGESNESYYMILESKTGNNMIISSEYESTSFSPDGPGFEISYYFLDPNWDDYYTKYFKLYNTAQWEKTELPSPPQ